MRSAPTIDTHAHVWNRSRTPQPWIDPTTMAAIDLDVWIDDLAAAQRETSIRGTILVQSANRRDETRDLLTAVDGIIVRGVVGWVDLEGDVEGQVVELGAGLVGVRHLAHQDSDPAWLGRESVGRGFEQLAALGLPFDLVVQHSQLELAAKVAMSHPEVTFVLDHIGKPPIATGNLESWSLGIQALAANANVVAKLSGLTVEANWSQWSFADLRAAASVAIDAFGPERLMFGSDWPLVNLTGGLTRWMEAAAELTDTFSADEQDAFYFDNAMALYSLEGINA